ncbi:MAG: polysaccharide deacetylase family protein [Negativicutes bacterium]|nr:polysaccharide deacetylase family protein [Negativicutes bacterium]MDR3589894.1 polysaccharide deacetylase family protein [Negativicutes bacterium]
MKRKYLPAALVAAVIALIWLGATGCAPAAKDRTPAPAVQPAGQTAAKTPPPAGIPVLMYHSIGEEKNNEAVIAKERFAEQMAFLAKQNFQPISLDELYAYLSGTGQLPAKPVVLTFDDGYRDTYEVALPILKQYGFKSVLFIPGTFAGERLSWQELKEMKAAGMEVQSHSLTHRDLGPMSPAEQAAEITKSKEMLDKFLDQDTRYFCYPNGSYNADTLRLLKEKGFRLAVTIEPGWVKLHDEPLTLKRVWMGNGVDLAHFEERLTRSDYSIL